MTSASAEGQSVPWIRQSGAFRLEASRAGWVVGGGGGSGGVVQCRREMRGSNVCVCILRLGDMTKKADFFFSFQFTI